MCCNYHRIKANETFGSARKGEQNSADFYQSSKGEKRVQFHDWKSSELILYIASCIGSLSLFIVEWISIYRLLQIPNSLSIDKQPKKRLESWNYLKTTRAMRRNFMLISLKAYAPEKLGKIEKKRVGKWLWKANLCRWMCKSELPSLIRFFQHFRLNPDLFSCRCRAGVAKWFWGGSIKKIIGRI